MRKASAAEKRILMLAGVLIISMLALVVVIRMLTGLESSREGQANVMANMIAISVNTLSTMDAGQMQKDFTLTKGSEPMTVEVYNKGGGAMYVKVTYDDKGDYYETPLLVSMAAIAPFKANSISVSKDITGKIAINGAIGGGWEWAATGDVPCSQPTKEKIMEYVNNAVNDPNVNRYRNVDAVLVKGIIGVESQGLQCVNGHLNVNKESGAAGLMQLMPTTADDINDPKKLGFNIQPKLNYKVSADNVKLGTAYLSYVLNLAGNDRNKAIASYNCGPGNIAKLANYGSDWMSHIDDVCKKETRPYVAKVNACMTACGQKECGIC
jgi:hypothetical protein